MVENLELSRACRDAAIELATAVHIELEYVTRDERIGDVWRAVFTQDFEHTREIVDCVGVAICWKSDQAKSEDGLFVSTSIFVRDGKLLCN